MPANPQFCADLTGLDVIPDFLSIEVLPAAIYAAAVLGVDHVALVAKVKVVG